MDTQSLRNLTFLMSLSGLSLACDEKGNSTTGATEGTTDQDTSTTDGTTETDGTAGETTSTSEQPTTTSMTEGTTESEPDIPFCEKFAALYVECVPGTARYFDELVMDCNMDLTPGEGDGPACVTALEEFQACLLSLDCRQFNNDDNGVWCEAESDAAYAACPSMQDE